MSSRIPCAVLLVTLLFLFAVRVSPAAAGPDLGLTPPYILAASWTDQPAHTGTASVDRLTGMGHVQASASGQSPGYQSIAGAAVVTSEWNFTGSNQGGSILTEVALQNLNVTIPSGLAAYLQVYLVMADFYPNGTLSTYAITLLWSRSTPASIASTTISNSTNWNWVHYHLYRSALIVSATAFTGTVTTASSQADFTVRSIAWHASTDFPANRVSCATTKMIFSSPYLAIADKTTMEVQGCHFAPNTSVKVSLVSLDGAFSHDVTPAGLKADSNGNFTASFTMPSVPSTGSYLVRATDPNGGDPDDAVYVTMAVPLPSLTLPQILPLAPIAVLIPILWGRRHPKRVSSRLSEHASNLWFRLLPVST